MLYDSSQNGNTTISTSGNTAVQVPLYFNGTAISKGTSIHVIMCVNGGGVAGEWSMTGSAGSFTQLPAVGFILDLASNSTPLANVDIWVRRLAGGADLSGIRFSAR